MYSMQASDAVRPESVFNPQSAVLQGCGFTLYVTFSEARERVDVWVRESATNVERPLLVP